MRWGFLFIFSGLIGVNASAQEVTLSWDEMWDEIWSQDTSYSKLALQSVREGDTYLALRWMDKRIQTDSLCPDLYLLRGYIMLWDTEYIEDHGDSIVTDFDRYLYLRAHPDEGHCFENNLLESVMEDLILNYKRPPEICARKLQVRGLFLLNGLNAYFKPGFMDHCELWKKAVECHFPEAEILLKNHCP